MAGVPSSIRNTIGNTSPLCLSVSLQYSGIFSNYPQMNIRISFCSSNRYIQLAQGTFHVSSKHKCKADSAIPTRSLMQTFWMQCSCQNSNRLKKPECCSVDQGCPGSKAEFWASPHWYMRHTWSCIRIFENNSRAAKLSCQWCPAIFFCQVICDIGIVRMVRVFGFLLSGQ